MNKVKIILAAWACALACAAAAGDTNSLATQIGAFENRTGAVIVKGFSPIGSIPLGFAQLSLGCKETRDVHSGEKIYGLIIEAEGNQIAPETVLVDDDEVAPLLAAINYLATVNNDVTTLGGFEATYTTRAGLRVIAESIRKEGAVQNYLKLESYPRIALTPVQVAQFAALIQQGRKDLDALKAGK